MWLLLAAGVMVFPDFNGDGVVEWEDYWLFKDRFGTVAPKYDLDGDGGLVDLDDFFIFADHFGERREPTDTDGTGGEDGRYHG